MPQGRRTTDRRRRVLYSAHTADSIPSTAADRRTRDKLREARQPTKAYGSAVNRRIRGRWFSLVPVQSRTMMIVSGLVMGVAIVLAYAHYACVSWTWLIYRPEIARPLRLDRPDSFGRWFTAAMLALSAGASLLIYQLRRYRNDDYRGQYRLWRIVVLVMLATSVNSLVSVVGWGGSILDALFARRVAFSGYDWLRIVLGIGGVILALRLVAEVRKSRTSLAALIVACALLALPEAAKWNLFVVDEIKRWALVTSAPLLGYTALFIALGGYLRMLFREVRGITDGDSISQRMSQWRSRLFVSKEPEPVEKAPRAKRRRSKPVEPDPEEYEEEVEEEEEETLEEESVDETDDVAAQESAPRKRRGWFGRKRETNDEEGRPRKKKRGWFSMRLDPPADDVDDEVAEEETDEPEQEESKPPKRKGRGLLSWRKNKKAEAETPDDDTYEDSSESVDEQESAENDDHIDPDEIDWDSMSKSERRRMRKKLKRQNRAA